MFYCRFSGESCRIEAPKKQDKKKQVMSTKTNGESRNEIETRHKKEVKALEGEMRAALKKAKALKGKKGKDALASVETEYDEKTKQMETRHLKELSEHHQQQQQQQQQQSAAGEGEASLQQKEVTFAKAAAEEAVASGVVVEGASISPEEEEEEQRQRKLEKARRKREKQKEKEKRREEEIAAETAAAGPSPRDIETAQLRQILQPLNLTIVDIPADGHCLYRAVAASTGQSYEQVRGLCASSLESNADEFAPFCEYTDDVPDFTAYIQRVRSSAEWGGHLELRALATALAPRPIHVYSTNQTTAMVIGGVHGNSESTNPIRLSYHLHYYALGEHYNQVVPTIES